MIEVDPQSVAFPAQNLSNQEKIFFLASNQEYAKRVRPEFCCGRQGIFSLL
jgi:hypothetical protein